MLLLDCVSAKQTKSCLLYLAENSSLTNLHLEIWIWLGQIKPKGKCVYICLEGFVHIFLFTNFGAIIHFQQFATTLSNR